MCILLLFNNQSQLSFSQIKEAMKFEDDVCKKNIFSLMQEKAKVLRKITNPEQKAIADDDTFEVNTSFTSQLKRVTVPVPITETVY